MSLLLLFGGAGTPPVVPPTTTATTPISVRQVKPPLGISAAVISADGAETIWWSGDRQAYNRPTGVTTRTLRGTGFADGGLILPRRGDLDWPDGNLYDTLVLVGDDGSTVYEGRIAATPRSFDAGWTMDYNLAGWMAHGQDRQGSEVYINRDPASWVDMPLNAKVLYAGLGVSIGDFSWTTEGGGLVCALPNGTTLSAQTAADLFYIAPTGVTIAKAQVDGADTSLPTGWESPRILTATADDGSGGASYTFSFGGGVQTVALTTPTRYVHVRHYSNANARNPASGAQRRFSKIALYGNHGLTTYPALTSGEPDGLYVADTIVDFFNRFAPKINAALTTNGGQVTPTTYPYSQLVADAMTPFDLLMEVNKWHLWLPGVYENRTLEYRPPDLSEPADWTVRLSDHGVKTTLQGDDTEHLAAGIIVQYTDLVSGRVETLYPDQYPDLLDESVENPANMHGSQAWPGWTISFPCTQDDALQLGRAFLAEFNQPKEAGEITITGHVRDAARHWQPYHRLRCGDTIAIEDFPNSRPRLIVETTADHDNKTIAVAVDSTFARVDAFIDRVTSHLQPLGV